MKSLQANSQRSFLLFCSQLHSILLGNYATDHFINLLSIDIRLFPASCNYKAS